MSTGEPSSTLEPLTAAWCLRVEEGVLKHHTATRGEEEGGGGGGGGGGGDSLTQSMKLSIKTSMPTSNTH